MGAVLLGQALRDGSHLDVRERSAPSDTASSIESKRLASGETSEQAEPAQAARQDSGEARVIAPEPPAPEPPSTDLVIAWQPSHQDDTGYNNWHEYLICSDIVDRVMAQLPGVTQVKAWDTSHGLTGSNSYRPNPTNTVAFDTEVGKANEAQADLFVSVHVDGGAPSGILGIYLDGDTAGRDLASRFVSEICARTGLPNRGVIAMRLYSLEGPDVGSRNQARYRCLLEVGDNQADRAFLESPEKRELVAGAMAWVVRNLDY